MAMRLRTLLGDHPCTAALKNGSIRSDLVEFDFADYSPTNKGFKPMVREGAFDVSEMAIVTYLMAKNFDKPMVLLPDVVMARFQHGYAFYNAKRGDLTPADLSGKRVGIRSFTTTTGAWLRGILANDYGVDLDCDRLGDLRGCPCRRIRRYDQARAGGQSRSSRCCSTANSMRCSARRSNIPDLKPLFADVEGEEKSWFAKHAVLPINHMVVVKQELSRHHPETVREVHRMLSESERSAPLPAPRFKPPTMRRSLE